MLYYYSNVTVIYLIFRSVCPVFFSSCRRLPETKRHSSLFLHWSGSKFLVVMAACTPSIHVYLGRPLSLLSRGIQSLGKMWKLTFEVTVEDYLLFRTERCCVLKNCAVVGYYAASNGNLLPTFRVNLSVPSPGVKNPNPETSARN